MKTKDTYNGFANYETWAVALWLGNDEGTYRYWRDAAADAKRPGAVNSTMLQRDMRASAAPKYRLAERLKDEVTEEAPELDGVFADLLHAALSEVDWHEVAETFLED
ncbi:MAG: hypothetical protein U0790_17760 [Isosphaeraceae bacterium]